MKMVNTSNTSFKGLINITLNFLKHGTIVQAGRKGENKCIGMKN